MAHPGKVGRPLARFACCVRNVRFESICAILGLEPSHQAAVNTADRTLRTQRTRAGGAPAAQRSAACVPRVGRCNAFLRVRSSRLWENSPDGAGEGRGAAATAADAAAAGWRTC
jgi:hypothetical protein